MIWLFLGPGSPQAAVPQVSQSRAPGGRRHPVPFFSLFPTGPRGPAATWEGEEAQLDFAGTGAQDSGHYQGPVCARAAIRRPARSGEGINLLFKASD